MITFLIIWIVLGIVSLFVMIADHKTAYGVPPSIRPKTVGDVVVLLAMIAAGPLGTVLVFLDRYPKANAQFRS